MAADGLITETSSRGMDETVAAFEAALKAKNLTVFARVDHGAGAKEAGMALRPTVLFVFGNPRGGTPLMQSSQTAGIDLPLKMLIWEDEAGKVKLSYNDPAWIAARHGAGSAAQQAVAAMTAVLAGIAAAAK